MSVMTESFTRSLRSGSLVGNNPRSLQLGSYARVLPREVRDGDSLSEQLADEGWRLAEWEGGFGRIFVRPDDFVMVGNTECVRVESREVDTGVVEVEDGFAIVATLGDFRSPMISRRENLKLEAQ